MSNPKVLEEMIKTGVNTLVGRGDCKSKVCLTNPHHEQHRLVCPGMLQGTFPYKCPCDKNITCSNRNELDQWSALCDNCTKAFFDHPLYPSQQWDPEEETYLDKGVIPPGSGKQTRFSNRYSAVAAHVPAK